MVRENRDRVGEERQPRESRGRETTEKERTVRREKPGE